jgi:hypothetical protein
MHRVLMHPMVLPLLLVSSLHRWYPALALHEYFVSYIYISSLSTNFHVGSYALYHPLSHVDSGSNRAYHCRIPCKESHAQDGAQFGKPPALKTTRDACAPTFWDCRTLFRARRLDFRQLMECLV